ncbi:MAG: hypothetical protein MJ025_07315, partial [Victivallaceae bacterium]|nr:hypothetical protein [Victivallaceae bacterium]
MDTGIDFTDYANGAVTITKKDGSVETFATITGESYSSAIYTEIVVDGGNADEIKIYDAKSYSDLRKSGITMEVKNGGTATGISLDNGGKNNAGGPTLKISDGGYVRDVKFTAGTSSLRGHGKIEVYAGGMLQDAVLDAPTSAPQWLIIFSGSASGILLTSSGTGSAAGAGGHASLDGGCITGSTVRWGGWLDLQSGAEAADILV